ncbi:predicted branched-chain amino acid permease [Paenibacillus popilliae ATCC 14706]|uniref:Predicted branched-chain amino acid permease n=1 Tax=Paenibacillus popilliae ATCC 14706 TaxID=1212764 RepID=M9LF14_PAEPP|nr:predicted branched-chain amino acid permease [Paenibacillus popilliae ATCC 14706]
MDAWIEIASDRMILIEQLVASYVDAWIEIASDRMILIEQLVASYVDAWIEIAKAGMIAHADRSHPMWMRGLKLR